MGSKYLRSKVIEVGARRVQIPSEKSFGALLVVREIYSPKKIKGLVDVPRPGLCKVSLFHIQTNSNHVHFLDP